MCLSRNTKSGEAARRSDIRRVDIVDTRTSWSTADRHLEPLQRIGVPLGNNFHAAVVLVADVTLETFALCGILDEEPKPDALYAPLHDVSSPDEHAELYREGKRKRAPAEASALLDH